MKCILAAPELPTMVQAGVQGYDVILWHGLIGPKCIPKAIVDRIDREASQIPRSKAMADALAAADVAPADGMPEQFRATIKTDNECWQKSRPASRYQARIGQRIT